MNEEKYSSANNKYPNLVAGMAVKKIKKKDVADAAGIDVRSLYNKLNGIRQFTLDEAMAIQKKYFADTALEKLFASE